MTEPRNFDPDEAIIGIIEGKIENNQAIITYQNEFLDEVGNFRGGTLKDLIQEIDHNSTTSENIYNSFIEDGEIRIEGGLEDRYVLLRAKRHSGNLFQTSMVDHTESHRIEEKLDNTVGILGNIAETYDEKTGGHIQRVGEYTSTLASIIGKDEEYQKDMKRYAPLHDIGKVKISRDILKKPGSLTEDEFDTMKTHTTEGASILSQGDSDLVKGKNIALYHHERFDGEGYPKGLQGKDIPLSARLTNIADSFDAIVSNRPYEDSRPYDDAFEEIKTTKGQFDPEIKKAFLDHFMKFKHIHASYNL